MDASHVYVGAWALGCFHSHNYYYPNLSEGADRVGGQSATSARKVRKKVPGSDARSVYVFAACWMGQVENSGLEMSGLLQVSAGKCCARARTHTHTRARAHARAHAHTYTRSPTHISEASDNEEKGF